MELWSVCGLVYGLHRQVIRADLSFQQCSSKIEVMLWFVRAVCTQCCSCAGAELLVVFRGGWDIPDVGPSSVLRGGGRVRVSR